MENNKFDTPHRRHERCHKLLGFCRYYKGEYTNPFAENDKHLAWNIEREWLHDLARSYTYADKMKNRKLAPLWKELSQKYSLPFSLVGYIFDRTCEPTSCFAHEWIDPFFEFLVHIQDRSATPPQPLSVLGA